MKALATKLGYSAAGRTVLAAILTPFLLIGVFTKDFAKLGLHVDEMYSGGPKIRAIQMAGYNIEIHRPVYPHMLQNENAFVQLDWKPLSALPPRVSEDVDVDGDGNPDIHVTFNVPKAPTTPLTVNVTPLTTQYKAMRDVGKPKFSSLIVRVDDAIVVRVPLADR